MHGQDTDVTTTAVVVRLLVYRLRMNYGGGRLLLLARWKQHADSNNSNKSERHDNHDARIGTPEIMSGGMSIQ